MDEESQTRESSLEVCKERWLRASFSVDLSSLSRVSVIYIVQCPLRCVLRGHKLSALSPSWKASTRPNMNLPRGTTAAMAAASQQASCDALRSLCCDYTQWSVSDDAFRQRRGAPTMLERAGLWQTSRPRASPALRGPLWTAHMRLLTTLRPYCSHESWIVQGGQKESRV